MPPAPDAAPLSPRPPPPPEDTTLLLIFISFASLIILLFILLLVSAQTWMLWRVARVVVLRPGWRANPYTGSPHARMDSGLSVNGSRGIRPGRESRKWSGESGWGGKRMSTRFLTGSGDVGWIPVSMPALESGKKRQGSGSSETVIGNGGLQLGQGKWI